MRYTIHQGSCLDVLFTLPANSVQCVVTSPPYFGLRDYGVDGQIGLEPTVQEYVANLVAVFREVRRVLRDDGVAWLNLGDSYANTGINDPSKVGGFTGQRIRAGAKGTMDSRPRKIPDGLKPKDLIGVPWRVAFALQDDGWWLRQDIIWHKPNPMPESVKDRCTKAHEYVFMLTKSARYFFDAMAVAEPSVTDLQNKILPRGTQGYANATASRNGNAQHGHINGYGYIEKGKRNRRSVWSITTKPYSGAHFATMPPELAEICIRASSRSGDVVLDPFNGSGTTGAVSIGLGREYVGIELNPAYIELAHARISAMQPALLMET